jgi:hypothetical protein
MWTITGLYPYEMEVNKPKDAEWACLGPKHKPSSADGDSLFGSQPQDDKERTQTESVRVLITRQERQMQNESVGIAITRQQESQMKTVCLGPNQKDNKEHMCRLTLFVYQSQDKTVTPSDTANRLKNFEMQQNLRYERWKWQQQTGRTLELPRLPSPMCKGWKKGRKEATATEDFEFHISYL